MYTIEKSYCSNMDDLKPQMNIYNKEAKRPQHKKHDCTEASDKDKWLPVNIIYHLGRADGDLDMARRRNALRISEQCFGYGHGQKTTNLLLLLCH